MKLFKYFCLLSFMASCSSEQTPQELLSVDLHLYPKRSFEDYRLPSGISFCCLPQYFR